MDRESQERDVAFFGQTQLGRRRRYGGAKGTVESTDWNFEVDNPGVGF